MDEPSEGRQNSFHGTGGGGSEQIKSAHAFRDEFEARWRVKNWLIQLFQMHFHTTLNPTRYDDARLCYFQNKTRVFWFMPFRHVI